MRFSFHLVHKVVLKPPQKRWSGSRTHSERSTDPPGPPACVPVKYLCFPWKAIPLLWGRYCCCWAWNWRGMILGWWDRGMLRRHWVRCGKVRWFHMHFLRIVSWRKHLGVLIRVSSGGSLALCAIFGLGFLRRGRGCRGLVLAAFRLPTLQWRASRWKRSVMSLVPSSGWTGWSLLGLTTEASSFTLDFVLAWYDIYYERIIIAGI